MVICEVYLCSHPRWAKLGYTGRNQATKALRETQMNNMWIFSFAIIYECNRFLYNEVSYSDGDRYSFPCLSFISYT